MKDNTKLLIYKLRILFITPKPKSKMRKNRVGSHAFSFIKMIPFVIVWSKFLATVQFFLFKNMEIYRRIFLFLNSFFYKFIYVFRMSSCASSGEGCEDECDARGEGGGGRDNEGEQ